MSFLSPLFLFGAATAAIPLILHLLKREPEPRLKFSAVKLLRQAPVELTEKRHLRELLLLALRIAGLVLLALAFARPFLPSGALGGSGVTIVAIDTSYSLSAPGRIERARQLAREAVNRVPAGEQVGIVTFSDLADIAAKPSADRALALAAINGVTAGFGSTRYRVGLHAAAEALGGHPGAIVVVTDLQESGWDAGDRAVVPESTRIEVADVGALPPNLAVTSVVSAGDRLLASIRNTDARARDTHVRLVLDGRPAGETNVSIGPNASAEVALPLPARASEAVVSIDDREGLQADNVRYAVLDAANRPAVLVVTATGDLAREAFYVQQALAAGAAAGGVYQVAGASGAQLSGWDPKQLAAQAAVLVLSTRGLERRGREALAAYVGSGGGLLIAAGPDIDGEVIADVLGPESRLRVAASGDARPRLRTLAPADVRHPIFQPFGDNTATLTLVKFQSVARVGGTECQTLARFTSGEAALVDCVAGSGRALVMASDLDNKWNDFPLHPSFVAFVHEAVRYLASARPSAGEYLVGDAPPGVRQTPGIAAMSGAGGLTRKMAINVDPREGDPARLAPADFQAAVARLKDTAASEARVEAAQQEDRQHLWRYVLVLMIAVLAFESAVASRTA